jgi:uncharacterized protein
MLWTRTLSYERMMRSTSIRNETRRMPLATDTRWATNPWTRLMGLMGRAQMGSGEALVFPGVKQIHTHFMRIPIDLVFYNRDAMVVGAVHALRPWRFSRYYRAAAGVIELPAGTLSATGTVEGDHLRFE